MNDAGNPASLDESTLQRLACPACLGRLSVASPGAQAGVEPARHLFCAQCARSYPILDGIPVLVSGRAE